MLVLRPMEIYWEITSSLGKKIRTTKSYWTYLINKKHLLMKGKEDIVKEVLTRPDQIRKSKIDKSVYLYYKQKEKLYCVVVKHLNKEGFLITAYPVDKVKEGEIVWTK